MLFEYEPKENILKPVSSKNIKDSLGENEIDLENYLKKSIGDLLFPQYFVFGNERPFQSEADLFAVNSNGDLIVFELKVHGQEDKNKVYQALRYAQQFSYWRYAEMNAHYKKCFHNSTDLITSFEEHFGFRIDLNEFNKNQKIIIISHSSGNIVNQITQYWQKQGIDIEEYYYRFYDIEGKKLFELSNELVFPQNSYNCWINTCSLYFPDAYVDMILNAKASAYGERIGIIGNWLNKSIIFLYHNGKGIIAAGRGTATIKDDYNKVLKDTNNNDETIKERNIKLTSFWAGVNNEGKIEKSISPSKIKELLGRDFYFPNTIVSLTSEEALTLFKYCQEIFDGK